MSSFRTSVQFFPLSGGLLGNPIEQLAELEHQMIDIYVAGDLLPEEKAGIEGDLRVRRHSLRSTSVVESEERRSLAMFAQEEIYAIFL